MAPRISPCVVRLEVALVPGESEVREVRVRRPVGVEGIVLDREHVELEVRLDVAPVEGEYVVLRPADDLRRRSAAAGSASLGYCARHCTNLAFGLSENVTSVSGVDAAGPGAGRLPSARVGRARERRDQRTCEAAEHPAGRGPARGAGEDRGGNAIRLHCRFSFDWSGGPGDLHRSAASRTPFSNRHAERPRGPRRADFSRNRAERGTIDARGARAPAGHTRSVPGHMPDPAVSHQTATTTSRIPHDPGRTWRSRAPA